MAVPLSEEIFRIRIIGISLDTADLQIGVTL